MKNAIQNTFLCVCVCVETVVFVVIHFAVITFERIDEREKPTCTQIHICNLQQKQPEQRNRCERKKALARNGNTCQAHFHPYARRVEAEKCAIHFS